VTSLQNLLASKGFSPGTVDGSFGPATETAVRNFQSNRRLTVRLCWPQSIQSRMRVCLVMQLHSIKQHS
jgi:peptidoglycan hydrolase-like protein with peptidoglycan-binding domain